MGHRVETLAEGVELHLGDCLEVLPTLGPVDMVAADLPYGTTRNSWDCIVPLEPLWRSYWSICSGPVVLTAQTPFDKVLGVSQLSALRYEWIWEKSHPTGHLNAKRQPMKAHENVLVFYRSQPTYNPQKTQGHKRKSATKRRDETPTYGKQTFDSLAYDSTERFPRSVLQFPSDKQTSSLHPTQKPVALFRYLVSTYTNPGDVVLDNTMGSGTTGVAAIQEGRRFIGIEIDPTYFDVACRRLEATLQATSQECAA